MIYVYDDAGNLQSADRPSGTSTDLFVHDAWNRLVGHAVDGESVVENAEYEYNALHWRTVKRRLAQSGVTPQERRLYYSAAWQVIQEDIDDNYATDPGIDRVSQQVWGLRYIDDAVFRRSYNPDIMEEEPEAHHYHCTDAQFSTLAMIGTGANPVLFERVRYRPYGEAAHRFPGDFDDDSYCNSADQTLLTNALNATIGQNAYDVAIDLNRGGVINSGDQTQFNWWSGRTPLSAGRISDAGNSTAGPGPDNPYGYCGYVFNAENLLYTVRFRWYEPVSGRWMERDPIEYADWMNLYQYSSSTPMQLVDSYGLVGGTVHHPYPLYLGGDPNQPCITLADMDAHNAAHEKLSGLIMKAGNDQHMRRLPGEDIHDYERRVWKKMSNDSRKAAILQSLEAAGIDTKTAKATIPDVCRNAKTGKNRTCERGTRRSNAPVLDAKGKLLSGTLAGAAMLLAAVDVGAALDSDPSCVSMLRALEDFMANPSDCDILQNAKREADDCFLAMGEAVNGNEGGIFTCTTQLHWEGLIEM